MKTIFINFVLVAVVSANLPPFVKICKRNSQLNDCLKNNINVARDHFKHGIPSLFLPKLDEIVIKTDTTIPLKGVNFTLRQGFNFSYLDSYDIKNVDLDLHNNRISIDWVWKRLQVKGNFKFEGTLLGLNVNGGSICLAQLANMGISLTMTGERQQKEDKNYIIFNDSDMKMELSQLTGSVSFGGIFPSAAETALVNDALNHHLKTTVQQFHPVVKDILVTPFINCIQRLFQKYSIEVLFPL